MKNVGSGSKDLDSRPAPYNVVMKIKSGNSCKMFSPVLVNNILLIFVASEINEVPVMWHVPNKI